MSKNDANAMNRIDATFGRLADSGGRAVMPYLTGGFPDVPTTKRLIERCDAAGAAAIEIGFPFSDSIADGPVIADSFHRVLANGFSVREIYGLVEQVRGGVSCPLLAMVSFSLVVRAGVRQFVARCRDCGFDGLIIPDLPAEEASEVAATIAEHGLKNVMLVATTTTPGRARRIVEVCTGFVYQVAIAGTTGERGCVPSALRAQVEQLRQWTSLPVCVGFGISSPEHVREVCGFADGAIIGSAIVRRITERAEAGDDADSLVAAVGGFVEELVNAV